MQYRHFLASAGAPGLIWLSFSGCASLQDELGARPAAMTDAPAAAPPMMTRPPDPQPVPAHSPPPMNMPPAGNQGMVTSAPVTGTVAAPRMPAPNPSSPQPGAGAASGQTYAIAPAVSERPATATYNDPARGYGVPAASVPATDPGLLPIPAYVPPSGGYAGSSGGPSWPNDGSNQLHRLGGGAQPSAMPASQHGGAGAAWPNDGSNQLGRMTAPPPSAVPAAPQGAGGAAWPNDGSNQLGRTAAPAPQAMNPQAAAMRQAAAQVPQSVLGQPPPASRSMAPGAPAHTADPHASAGHGAEVHWSYEGSTGPEAWGALQPDYKLCNQGRNQSPVDIPAGLNVEPYPLQLQYRPLPLTVLNNGHTLQLSNPTDSRMLLEGEAFQLVQLHFHSPSEHKVQGRAFPLEMHLVHKNAAGVLAVLGVLFEEGPDNPILERIWQLAPRTSGQTQEAPGLAIDLESMISLDMGFVRYSGSLTTPPCSEGVRWFVLNQPNYLSAQQTRAFLAINGPNARPVQYVLGRPLLRSQ